MIFPVPTKIETKMICIWFYLSKGFDLVLVALDNKIKIHKSRNLKKLKKMKK